MKILNEQLAAQFHIRQIDAIIRLELIVEDLQKDIDYAADATLDVAAIGKMQPRIATMIWSSAIQRIRMKLQDAFDSFHRWSWSSTVEIYAKTIPRSFYRKINPKFAISGLENVQDGIPNYRLLFGISDIAFRLFNEPVLAKRKKLSDKEWLSVLQELIFPAPTEQETMNLIYASDEFGLDWQDRILNLSRKIPDVDRLARELAKGFSDGENQQQLKNRIKPLVSGIESSTKRVVRTEGLRIAERTQRKAWDDLGEMMMGVQILAVLDQNTRQHHALRNGTIYYKQPAEGQQDISTIPMLPDEPNCRCWSVPVMNPPKEFLEDPLVMAEFKNAAGDVIPSPTTYDRWFSDADPVRRKLAVGTRRYNAMKAKLNDERDLEWSDFIDDQGRLLPIETIKNESVIERAARKELVAKMIAERRQRISQVSQFGFAL